MQIIITIMYFIKFKKKQFFNNYIGETYNKLFGSGAAFNTNNIDNTHILNDIVAIL